MNGDEIEATRQWLTEGLAGDGNIYLYRVLDILRVVDGDTIDARLSLGFGLTAAFRFRLADVDTPEIYGVNSSPEGHEAKEFVEHWLDRPLLVETYKSSDSTVGIGDGAFGRWLGDFIDVDSGGRLTDALREAGYA